MVLEKKLVNINCGWGLDSFLSTAGLMTECKQVIKTHFGITFPFWTVSFTRNQPYDNNTALSSWLSFALTQFSLPRPMSQIPSSPGWHWYRAKLLSLTKARDRGTRRAASSLVTLYSMSLPMVRCDPGLWWDRRSGKGQKTRKAWVHPGSVKLQCQCVERAGLVAPQTFW